MAMLGAVLDLFNIPVGTILGIVILWYLTRPHVVKYFYKERNSKSDSEPLDVIFNVPNSNVISASIFGMLLGFFVFGMIISSITQNGIINQNIRLILILTWLILFALGVPSLYSVFKTKNKSLFVLSILFMSVSIGFLSLIPVYFFEKHYVNKLKKTVK